MLGVKDIEDLIIGRIKEKLPYLAKVDSYEPEYDVPLNRLIHKCPMVIVVLDSVKQASGSIDLSDFANEAFEYTFIMGVISRDLRGAKESRRGDEGAYRIMDDLFTHLQNQQLSPELSPLEFRWQEYVTSAEIGVIYKVAYSVVQIGG